MVLNLGLFDVRDVDENSFGLYKIVAIDENKNHSRHESKQSDKEESITDINDFKELKKMNLKRRLQQFETNYEIKFTTKKQK